LFSITCRVGRVGVVALALTLIPVAAADAQGGLFSRQSVSSDGEQGNGPSFGAATSGDGRFTAFVSNASSLVAGDTNGRCDTFVRDAAAGTTTRVSLTSTGAESVDGFQCGFAAPAISGDGRYVAFVSDASDLVPGDANGQLDVFVRDRVAGTTRRVSVSSAGTEGNGNSFEPAISADGRFVAFTSGATNLVEGQYVSDTAVYVHDLATGATEWVSVPRSGDGINAGRSYQPSLSADGRYVAFASQGDDLVEGDTNLRADVFVRDRADATTSRVSIASDGTQADTSSTGSEDPAISADGRHVAFTSDARNLVPGVDNSNVQVYVRDRVGGITTVASLNDAGEEGFGDGSLAPSISGDGRYVAFHTRANNLYPGHVFDTTDVVVRDTVGATTKAITVGRRAGDFSAFPSLSADGSSVAFASTAAYLVDGDTNDVIDVFRRAVTGADENPPALGLPDPISVPATSPDGTVVEYVVTADDDTDPDPAVACRPASGSTFAIGDTTVTCTATDASGNEATGSFIVHVRGAGEQIDDLQHLFVVVTDIPPSMRQSLGAKLAAAEASLGNGRVDDACNALKAFIAEAAAQSGRQLTADVAAVLVEDALRIRAVLACR
jgi:Tol biopolymer transport system component